MENEMKQKQVTQDAKNFLKENNIAVVATSVNNEPHVATVYYYTFDSLNLYFYTKENTTKAKNVKTNPNMAVMVGTGPEHITVQAYGQAHPVLNQEEKVRIFEKLIETGRKKGIKMWPTDDMEKLKGKENVILKFTPTKMTFMNLDCTRYPNSIGEKFYKIEL